MNNSIKRRIRSAEKATEKPLLMITTLAQYISAAISPEGLEGKTVSPELKEAVRKSLS